MDLTSVKMKQGEGQWQDKYNRLVDTVEKVGGGSKRPPMD